MYFVMTQKDCITVAMTRFEDVAKAIADNFVEPCTIAWSTYNKENQEHENFAEKA